MNGSGSLYIPVQLPISFEIPTHFDSIKQKMNDDNRKT